MVSWTQILVDFLVGGIFIAMQTLVAERVKPVWRSIILTLPSTVALGLFFVGLQKSPADALQVAVVTPAGQAAAYLFVTVFAVLSRFGLAVSYFGGLLSWILLDFLFLKFPPANFFQAIFLYGLPLIFILYKIVEHLPQKHNLKIFPMNFRHIAVRSLLGGIIIAAVVVLSRTLGNVWGGLFTTFPATFSSTLLIYYHLQGKEVIPAVIKSLFFPGAFGFMLYAVVAAWTFPEFGIWLGTLASFGITIFFYILYIRIFHGSSRSKNTEIAG